MDKERRIGVCGILRVKNDASFIQRCVESCIDALDELVIVFNDCSDNSEEIIGKMQNQYPDKIKVYEYPYKVYGANLTYDEYESAKRFPDDSPHLLCNYYNFALSKVSCKYALKIDADQIYFTDELRAWCDFCRSVKPMSLGWKCLVGMLFQFYLSVYRLISYRIVHFPWMLPQFLIDAFNGCYIEYAKYLFSHDRGCLSMAGINIFVDDTEYVSLGNGNDVINILPPFNGEGDHVIFRVSDSTYYKKFDMAYYNKSRSSNYSLIEEFVHPYRIMFIGFFWRHISSMRPNVSGLVRKVKVGRPTAFMRIEDFMKLDYKNILKITDRVMFSPFQRVLFSFIYKANREKLKTSL